MWRPTKNITQMEKHVTEDSKRAHNDNESTGNVDSGFLSGGNLQYSGEICNSGLIEGHNQEHQLESEQRPAAASTTAVSSSSLSTSSSSLTASTKILREPMRVVDSGLNVDLSENLSLNLKHVSLNPLSGKERIQTEPKNVELIFVTTRKGNGSPCTHQENRNRDECNTTTSDERDSRTNERSNEENWQLYYTQNNDGDT
jgi:hypothetical protein